ncbi:hypothetical protein EVAR_63243_1 [Eumeta japonica]|uniref:Uncharacterized protein n=1 Tax=Eumeta variegata TaxID=151549 RepID=A0A4C1ZBX9_EUMVA|nr:hypothetical protein EVAR_63243_1 [Eumeta japonica]
MLLVSFNLWKETTFCIHCSPVDGESGCMYMRLGISGSALPATIHRLRDKGNKQNVLRFFIETRNANFVGRKHTSASNTREKHGSRLVLAAWSRHRADGGAPPQLVISHRADRIARARGYPDTLHSDAVRGDANERLWHFDEVSRTILRPNRAVRRRPRRCGDETVRTCPNAVGPVHGLQAASLSAPAYRPGSPAAYSTGTLGPYRLTDIKSEFIVGISMLPNRASVGRFDIGRRTPTRKVIAARHRESDDVHDRAERVIDPRRDAPTRTARTRKTVLFFVYRDPAIGASAAAAGGRRPMRRTIGRGEGKCAKNG